MPDRFPVGSRDPEPTGKGSAVAGERDDRLLARRVQHPPLQPVRAPDGVEAVEGRRLVPEARDMDGALREPGRPGDRGLVVDHTHGDAPAAEAADDPQPLVVAADDDCAGLSRPAGERPGPRAPGGPQPGHVPAATGSAAGRPVTDRLRERLAYQ